MIGQGRPLTKLDCLKSRSSVREESARSRSKSLTLSLAIRFMSWFILLTWASLALADSPSPMRVRIAWGGSIAQKWTGSISTDQAPLGQPTLLGSEPDTPGSIWLDSETVVRIEQPSSRFYDGFDLTVDGPVEATVLKIQLNRSDRPDEKKTIKISLRDIISSPLSRSLDDEGTRLLVRRSPGDKLRVRLEKDSLVFAPGDIFRLDLLPSLLGENQKEEAIIKVSLVDPQTEKTLWQNVPIELDGSNRPISLSVPLKVKEGVYDLEIHAQRRGALSLLKMRSIGQMSLGLEKKLAYRKIQLMVIESKSPSRPDSSKPFEVIEEIDPANPNWWDRFAKSSQQWTGLSFSSLNLPKGWTSGLVTRLALPNTGSADLETYDHRLGRLVRLRPSGPGKPISWEAYTLSVENLGTPHILELDYPDDVSQSLGISLIEPNAAGAIVPLQLDSGVSIDRTRGRQTDSTEPEMLRHRILFWPKTKSPIVLLTNQSAEESVVHGKIRLLAGPKHFSQAAWLDASKKREGRLIAGYMDRPWFAKNFGATQKYDEWSRRSLDDWQTFYQGGTRLVEYLDHVGFGGLVFSAYCEGAALYPGKVARSMPRFDRGAFFNTGQDPLPKDLLGLLSRLFDRDGLRLIPSVEFASTLDSLESLLRDLSPAERAGIRLIGPDGRSWTENYYSENRLAPYYNPLDPRVQQAMLRVIDELVHRAARGHGSFAGLAIQLAGYGYASLPGPQWGLDDTTIASFESDMKIQLPAGGGPDRFARRWEVIKRNHFDLWLTWRAMQMNRFYASVRAIVKKAAPEATVYLTTANLMTGPYWDRQLRPTLRSRPSIDRALLEVGIDQKFFKQASTPVLVYPNRIGPASWTADSASQWEARRWLTSGDQSDWSGPGGTAAELLYYRTGELRLDEFDNKNPYSASFTSLRSQILPSNDRYRQGFAEALARRDATVILQGGHFLPMGQEQAVYKWIDTYRRLPDVPFKTIPNSVCPDGTDPVVIRQATVGDRTYFYLVNNSPVKSTVTLKWDMSPGAKVSHLGSNKSITNLTRQNGQVGWKTVVLPYELVAIEVESTRFNWTLAQVEVPKQFLEQLALHSMELARRTATLRAPPSWDRLSNRSFEKSSDTMAIPGWRCESSHGSQARLEQVKTDGGKPPGNQALRLSSDGPTVTVLSDPFEGPASGRLWMYAWLRVPDESRQPTLELILTGKADGQPFSRVAELGRSSDGQPAPKIQNKWAPYSFSVDDLPIDRLSELQVGFRLIDSGEVWVDDVQLDHLAGFDVTDIKVLSQMFATAHVKQQHKKIGECIRILDGYWSRYLEKNVPLKRPIVESVSTATVEKDSSKPTDSIDEKIPVTTGFMDRLRGYFPKKLW
jgi:Glycosyl hydrolase-like 10